MFSFNNSNDDESFNLNPVLSEGLHNTITQQQFIGHQDDSSLPLSHLIQKIISQRGSFLNVTEDGLLDEMSVTETSENNEDEEMDDGTSTVQKQQSTTKNNDEIVDNGGDGIDRDIHRRNKTHEEFLKDKEEIINCVHSALNESSLSLDFISLLISCVRPAAGSLSMSPHLKQNIKIGSLSSDNVQIEKNDNNNQSQIEISRIGRGWKLESLNRCSKNFKVASLRLSKEVAKERNYWNGLVNVLKSNEVITTTTTSSSSSAATKSTMKEISVKYGFGDAGSNYFDKGVGLLKKNPVNGEIYFEKINNQQTERVNKLVKVKLYSKEGNEEPILIGESNLLDRIEKFTNSNDGDSENGVCNEISRARFFLFEEELFYQLVKESATLISLQAKIESNKILIELHDEIIEIESISVDDIKPVNPDLKSNLRADQISSFLRLMLINEHRRNLNKKHIPPVSLSQDNQQSSQSSRQNNLSLIKPIIMYNKHDRTVKQLQDVLISTLSTFFNGDRSQVDTIMENDFKLTKFCNDINYKDHDSVGGGGYKYKDPFIRCITSPLTKFELNCLNLKIFIKLRSNSSSSYSTINVKIFNYKDSDGDDNKDKDQLSSSTLLNVNFTDIRQLEDCLNWAIKYFTSKD